MRSLFILFLIQVVFSSCQNPATENIKVESVTSNFLKIPDANTFHQEWNRVNTLVYQVNSEPPDLHPANGNSALRAEIFLYTQRPLFSIGYVNQEITPVLIENPPVKSADGLHYHFTLRQGIFWDDGSPLSINDINFTIKASKCPLTNNGFAKTYWENVKAFHYDKNNPYKFSIELKKSHVLGIYFLSDFPVMEQIKHDPGRVLDKFSLEEFDSNSEYIIQNSALKKWAEEFNSEKSGRDIKRLNGLGGYRIARWNPGEEIVLEKKLQSQYDSLNLLESKDPSYPDKIIFRVNKDESSVMLEFKSQIYDASVGLSAKTLLSLSSEKTFSDNYNFAFVPTYNYTYLAFNTRPDGEKRKMLFDESAVRKAIAGIVPVDRIMNLVYGEYKSNTFRIPSCVSPLKKSEYNDTLQPLKHTIAEAKKILLESGWSDSNKDGILDKMKNGKLVELKADLHYLTASPDWKDIAVIISEELLKVGVKVNLVPMELKLFIEHARSHDFDLMLGSWGGSSLPEDFSQLWHTDSWLANGSNYSGFGNAQTDLLIDSINGSFDILQRNNLSKRLQAAIYEQQPCVFLYASLRRVVLHKRFGNVAFYAEKPGLLLDQCKLLSE